MPGTIHSSSAKGIYSSSATGIHSSSTKGNPTHSRQSRTCTHKARSGSTCQAPPSTTAVRDLGAS